MIDCAGLLLASVAIAAGAACHGGRASPPRTREPDGPSPELSRAKLRDGARLVLERHCGECHIRDFPSAFPAALAVYDLRDEEWASKMSNQQLAKLKDRIREGALFDEFDVRNKGKGPPPAPTTVEQRTVRDYVDRELARRNAR